MRSHSSQRQQSWCVPGQRNPVTRFLALATIFSTLLLTACSTAPRALSPAEADAAVQARWAAAPWPPKPLPDTNPNVPRERLPYFWPYPEVPAPKWPEPHPDAKPDRGMSRIEYFNKLCRLEAGEFIY